MCARHYAKHFLGIISLSPHISVDKHYYYLISLMRTEAEKQSSLLKVTEVVSATWPRATGQS